MSLLLGFLSASSLSISIFDAITVTESVIVKIPISVIVSDTITVTDSVIVYIPISVFASDDINETESVIVKIPISFSVFDSITVGESVQVIVNPLVPSVFDSITITESVQVIVNPIAINVFDNISVTENVVVQIPINILVFDDIVATESVSLQFNPLLISVFDSITVNENVTVQIPMSINVFDDSIASESVIVQIPMSVNVFDSLFGSGLSYSAEVLADTPLVYYRKDDLSGAVLTDVSGNGLNGSIIGNPIRNAPALIRDAANAAIAYNRPTSTDFCAWNGSITLNPRLGSMSWEFWFATAQSTNSNFFRRDTGGSNNGYLVRINQDAPGRIGAVLNNAIAIDSGAGVVYSDGIPHHVVIILNRVTDRYQMYVDGKLKADGNAASQHSVDIGGVFTPTGSMGLDLAGTIDEVAVYGSALTPDRILAHYDAGRIIDNATVKVSVNISVFDDDIATEFVNVIVATGLAISVFDSITLDEFTQALLNPIDLDVADIITVNEFINIQLTSNTIEIIVEDTIIVTDYIALNFSEILRDEGVAGGGGERKLPHQDNYMQLMRLRRLLDDEEILLLME